MTLWLVVVLVLLVVTWASSFQFLRASYSVQQMLPSSVKKQKWRLMPFKAYLRPLCAHVHGQEIRRVYLQRVKLVSVCSFLLFYDVWRRRRRWRTPRSHRSARGITRHQWPRPGPTLVIDLSVGRSQLKIHALLGPQLYH